MKNNILLIVIAVSLLLTCTVTVYAHNMGFKAYAISLDGIVIDGRLDDWPETMAVNLENSKGKPVSSAMTDKDGGYRIWVAGGSYCLYPEDTKGAEPVRVTVKAGKQVKNIDFAPSMLWDDETELLVQALQSGNEWFRTSISSLTDFRRLNYKATVPALIELLKSNDPDVRSSSAELLGNLGVDSNVIVPLLIEALADIDPFVRVTAIKMLGEIGADAREAGPFLIEMYKNTALDMNVRLEALTSAIQIGFTEETVYFIFSLLKINETDYMIRDRAAKLFSILLNYWKMNMKMCVLPSPTHLERSILQTKSICRC